MSGMPNSSREPIRKSDRPGVQDQANRCIHELFEEQAAELPERTAIVLDGQAMTYRELNQRANQLAGFLRVRGVGPDTIVAVYLERSFDLLASILGILKAGGAYLPIDPAYPQGRVEFMLEDAGVKVLITQQTLAPAKPPATVTVVSLDHPTFTWPEAWPAGNQVNSVSAANLAYVIYTSGSTGKPKGVLVTHHNVIRLFSETRPWFRFNERDVWTFFHSAAFDFSVWEIWGALLHGGKLVIVPYLVSRSPEMFYELVHRERVTVLNQTPSAFRQLMRVEQAGVQPKPLNLRYIIFGGEMLEMRSLKPWFDRHGDQTPQLINMYGITETTVHVTYRRVSREDLGSGSVIGAPIPDLQLYILNSAGDPAAVGEAGELFVGGAGLARGYLNRPELNEERFMADPFSQRPGARIYRTGDLARSLANGDVEYLGRIDQQVKIRGFRIELGEIEVALNRHNAIAEAVVLVREDRPGDKYLAAYLIVRGGTKPAWNDLRNFLKLSLPEYMVPSAFVFLEKFPLNNNGKLDRDALLALPIKADAPRAAIATASDLERNIYQLWRETLRGAPIGLDDNFFDLGGDSLLQAQIHTRLQGMIGREFPITDLFMHSTIRTLAKHLGGEEPKTVKPNAFQERARRQQAALGMSGSRPIRNTPLS